ncbi:permease [Aromatoleum evansii]|uniref:permease n=1 Tax=Aromatoleum evansii TaxID=59406 RepID=UPI00145DE6EC|nr:permease [Aromatoleum evansii]NMG29732.1 permease [Aromatoleum evansii]
MRADSAHEQPRCGPAAWRCKRRALACVALAFAAALAGCANVRSATAELPALPQMPPLLGNGSAPVRSALAYHESIRGMNAADLARERSALAGAGNAPLTQMKQAMLLSHPQGNNNLQRAQSLLEAINGSEKSDAVALQPLARLLAEQLQERVRLDNTAERLTQQLERTGQQLKDAQKQSEQLQEKLDALTEIERTLPARPSAPTPPLPSSRERRSEK